MSLFDLQIKQEDDDARNRAEMRRHVVEQYNASRGKPPLLSVTEAELWLDLLAEEQISVYEQDGVLEIRPAGQATPGRLATLDGSGESMREAMRRRKG